MPDDYEEDRKSKFNAGVALAERIDGLQRALNMARFNPLMKNPETMTFNYEVVISAENGLLSEAWAKLNTIEQKDGLRISKTIQGLTKVKPPISTGRNGDLKINKEDYEKLLELLFFFERKLKEWLDIHNLNAPDSDDDEGL